MKVIALCVNVQELDQGGYADKNVCKKYPGSGWMPYLVEYANQSDYTVLTGSKALDLAKLNGSAKGMLVIQEESNEYATVLLGMGATPAVLFCLESPLYAPVFYDHLDEISKKFPFSILFGDEEHPVYFPSFDLNEIPEPKKERIRKYVMVVSNKHYSDLITIYGNSKSFQLALHGQRHDLRYSTIFRMSLNGSLDLFGKGWPKGFAKEIDAGDKISVMSDYLISPCIENITMNGYVTEKLIDCLVAGVLPLYGGAHDIEKYVPKDVLFSGSDKAEQTLENGQRFIRSDAARKFSYQGFAENVLELVMRVGKL